MLTKGDMAAMADPEAAGALRQMFGLEPEEDDTHAPEEPTGRQGTGVAHGKDGASRPQPQP